MLELDDLYEIPTYDWQQLDKAKQLFKDEAVDDAIAILDQLMTNSYEEEIRVMAHYFMGKCYVKKHEPVENVENVLREAILQDNYSILRANACFDLAEYYRSFGLYDEALAYYDVDLKIKPNDIVIITNVGLTYLSLAEKKNDESKITYAGMAFDCYYKVIELNERTKNIVAKRKNDNIGYIGMCDACIKLGEIEAAKEYLRKVKPESNWEKERVNKSWANIYFFEKDWDKVLIFLEINARSKDFKVRTTAKEKMGCIYIIREQYNEAVSVLEEIIAEDKSDQIKDRKYKKFNYPHYLLAKVYYELGKYEKAYDHAMQAGPKYSKGYLYAIKSAIHFDDPKAMVAANSLFRLQGAIFLKQKAVPYLLYLSKKHNIGFKDLELGDYTVVGENILDNDSELALYDFISQNSFNSDLNMDIEEFYWHELPSLLANATPKSDGIYDAYHLFYPGIGLNGEDWLEVKTLPNTKSVIGIKLLTSEQVYNSTLSMSVSVSRLTRSLFR